MDRYDEAVEYLCAHPEQVNDAWMKTGTHQAGCLFQMCGFPRTIADMIAGTWSTEEGRPCGCLTMIRFQPTAYCAQTAALTKRVLADERIPLHYNQIPLDPTGLRECLEVFAGWQREIDRVLGRNGVPKETEATEFMTIPEPTNAETPGQCVAALHDDGRQVEAVPSRA